jgi:hypothetical protein
MREALDDGLAAAGLTLVGQRLGPYWVDQLIGVGGMGEVYRGERADGEFHQRVAIKVVRGATNAFSIDFGPSGRSWPTSLIPPSRAFTMATTQSGEPYFVMEYIERIGEYSKSRNAISGFSPRPLPDGRRSSCGGPCQERQLNVQSSSGIGGQSR